MLDCLFLAVNNFFVLEHLLIEIDERIILSMEYLAILYIVIQLWLRFVIKLHRVIESIEMASFFEFLS